MSKPASQQTFGDYTEPKSPDEPALAADTGDSDLSPAEQALEKYDGAQYGQTSRYSCPRLSSRFVILMIQQPVY